MSEILMSFGCGIAFAVGLCVGVATAMMAVASNRRDAIEHSKQVLSKLAENVEVQKRIAASVEALAITMENRP